jgi:hypothetical protein
LAFKRNGFEVKRLKNIPWDDEAYQNLCKLMKTDLILRVLFLRNYESVLHESGALKARVPFSEWPHSNFTEAKNADSLRNQKYSGYKNMAQIIPMLTNTYSLREIVDKLIKGRVLIEEDPFHVCASCKKFIIGFTGTKCPKCKKDLFIFKVFKLPYNIEQIWQDSPGKNLEALCYNSLKMENIPNIKNINASTEIGEIGEKFFKTYTELDVAISFNKKMKELSGQNVLVILCSTNPSSGSEKKESTKMSRLNYPFIFVTNDTSLPDKIKENKNCVKYFTSVSKDSDFPQKLIDYVKSLTPIE